MSILLAGRGVLRKAHLLGRAIVAFFYKDENGDNYVDESGNKYKG